MYNGKRILAIIPARSGSKGLPDKNIRDFCGKPLIAHSINGAIKTEVIDTIFVSTDSEKYAEISKSYGASVPFLRPDNIASDTSPASDYIMHAIESFEQIGEIYDYVMVLQPTSPLRQSFHIMQSIAMVIDRGLESVVSFSEADHPIEYYHYLPDDLSLAGIDHKISNRQEARKAFRVNGMIYVSSVSSYLRTRSFYSDHGKAIIINMPYAIDIDSETDFVMAEYINEKLISLENSGVSQ